MTFVGSENAIVLLGQRHSETGIKNRKNLSTTFFSLIVDLPGAFYDQTCS